MTTLRIKLAWRDTALGSFDANISNGQIRLRPHLNDNVEKLPDGSLRQIQSIVRTHTREFLKDPRYSSFENIDSGIKTDIRFA